MTIKLHAILEQLEVKDKLELLGILDKVIHIKIYPTSYGISSEILVDEHTVEDMVEGLCHDKIKVLSEFEHFEYIKSKYPGLKFWFKASGSTFIYYKLKLSEFVELQVTIFTSEKLFRLLNKKLARGEEI